MAPECLAVRPFEGGEEFDEFVFQLTAGLVLVLLVHQLDGAAVVVLHQGGVYRELDHLGVGRFGVFQHLVVDGHNFVDALLLARFDVVHQLAQGQTLL